MTRVLRLGPLTLAVALLASTAGAFAAQGRLVGRGEFPVEASPQQLPFKPSVQRSPAAVAQSALDASAQLDRLLRIAGDHPAFEPGRFGACLPSSAYTGDIHEELWCQECRESGQGWQASLRFFPDPDAHACTLQHVEMTTSDVTLLDRFREHLGAAWGLTARQAPFVEQDRLWLADPVGTPYRWRLGESRAWLYQEQGRTGVAPVLVFLWRDDQLVAMLNAAWDWEKGGSYYPRRDVLLEACRQAGGEHCSVLTREPASRYASPSVPPDAAFRSSLLRLAGSRSEDPNYAAQLYWTRWLGDVVASLTEYPEDAAKVAAELNGRFPELAAVQATLTNNSWKGETVVFESPFEARLHRDFLHERWGRRSFVEYLNRSWVHQNGCEDAWSDGTGPARGVVALAETFLRQYPETESSDEVRRALAAAYETWWSLSKYDHGGAPRFDLASLRADGEKARVEALMLYRRLAQAPGASIWLEDRVFRLEHDLDTHERRYGCSVC